MARAMDHLRFNNQQIRLNVIEQLLTEFVTTNVSSENQCVLVIPNEKFIFPLALELFHADYEDKYKTRADFGRRASVLIVTNSLTKLMSFFVDLHVSVQYIFETSIGKQQFFSGKRDNNMNDYYNTQSYWKDRLFHRYKNRLPQELPYRFTFPVSVGHKRFVALSRGHFARVDNIQQSCFYVTSNRNIFNLSDLPVFDYALIDCIGIKHFVSVPPGVNNVIYLFDNLLDNRLSYLKNTSICAVDANLVEQVIGKYGDVEVPCYFSVPLRRMKQCVTFEGLRFEKVAAPFDKELEQLTKYIGKFSAIDGHQEEKELIRLLYSNIFVLPVSAVEYDTVACKESFVDSNIDLLKELKSLPDLYENIDIARCAELLEDIFRQLDNDSPKQKKIFDYVEKAVGDQSNLLILTSRKTVNKALRLAIAEYCKMEVSDLEEKGIHILTVNKVEEEIGKLEFETVLLVSCTKPSTLNVLRKIKYRRAVVLMYAAEMAILKMAVEKLNRFIKNAKPKSFEQKLFESGLKYEIDYYDRLLKKLKEETVSIKESGFYFDLDEFFEAKRTLRVYENATPNNATNLIMARRVLFEDGSVCFFNNEKSLKVCTKDNKAVTDVPVSKLAVGDTLLFIDEQVSEDLFLEILKKFKNNANYLFNLMLVEKWQEKLEDGCLSKKFTHSKLFEELKKRGWKKVSTDTVKNWLERKTLGPDDPLDIKLVGEILNIKFFVEQYSLLFEAMEKIRILHRTLARVLNQTIFASHEPTQKMENEVFKTFGVSLLDLQNALETKTIMSIDVDKYYWIKKSDEGKIYYP